MYVHWMNPLLIIYLVCTPNVWSSSTVHQLIDLYSQLQSKFSSVKYQKKNVWELIWQELVKKVTWAKQQSLYKLNKNGRILLVEQKWKNITKELTDVVENNNRQERKDYEETKTKKNETRAKKNK